MKLILKMSALCGNSTFFVLLDTFSFWYLKIRNSLRPCPGSACRLLGIALILVSLGSSGTANADLPPVERLRPSHPRIFLTADQIAFIKTLSLPQNAEYFQLLKGWAESEIEKEIQVADLGTQAVTIALVFIITDDSTYLGPAKEMLEKSFLYYRLCDQAGTAVSWYSTTRINAIAAYDLLFNHLSPSERTSIGLDILSHVAAVQPDPGQEPPPGRNLDDYTGGFYGTPSLLWYAGLATYGEGIDDALAEQFLNLGYSMYHDLLEYRSSIANSDGGLVTYSLNYSFVAYPWAEFNFFHSMKAAFGLDIASQWPYVAYTAHYVLWNLLPGGRWFGAGDAYHLDNKIPDLQAYTHLSQIMHFYGWTLPTLASLAGWLQSQFQQQSYSYDWPMVPFLLTGLGEAPASQAPPTSSMPLARYFKGMGQILMRSGWGDDDVFAQFIAGAPTQRHKHFDEGGFAIYYKGFLALDSGSRPEMGDYQTSAHTFNYYPRTIAHNCLLIRMPGEVMPSHWGIVVEPTPNDGGQNQKNGGRITAFETNADYTYISSDLTDAYHPDKCALAERRMVFIPPRHFIIFDKVISKSADQKKTWLLHTAREPSISDVSFSAEHMDGKIRVQTLLPLNPQVVKIGGPGKQFWNDGQNWSLPEGYQIPNDHELAGQWRVEVSPSVEKTQDYFLHLIEVRDKNSSAPATQAALIFDDSRVGLELSDDGMTATLSFSRGEEANGRITMQKDGRSIDRPLSTVIQEQKSIRSIHPARTILILSRLGRMINTSHK